MPAIVHIVLSQIARLRGMGELTEAEVLSKTARLVREELFPRGLRLQREQLTDGRVRFVVETSDTGEIRDMVEYTNNDMGKSVTGADFEELRRAV